MYFIYVCSLFVCVDICEINIVKTKINISNIITLYYEFRILQHWECKLIVSVFTYAVAASMMWIFMEGLYLHMLVYKTLFTERTGIRMYVVIGWRKYS